MANSTLLRPLGSLTLAFGALALGACGDDAPSPLAANGRPVVLISIDSLRADHCTPWGYRPEFAPDEPTTPFLDELAAAGVRFAAAQAPTSWTLPSHVSLVTGMNCLEHGVRNRAFRLDDRTEHVAGRFHRAGYATGGFYSAPFLHPAWGFLYGFDKYEPGPDYLLGLDSFHAVADAQPGSLRSLHNSSHEDVRCSERVVDKALAWLDTADEDGARPKDGAFFLFLHLWDPHYDYQPPEEYADLFLPPGTRDKTYVGFDEAREIAAADLPRVKALYDAEIRYTDDQVARLWRKLEAWGLADDVVFAVVSDHGDEFYEHGSKGHQRTLYEEVTHVPMVVRADGAIPAGTVVATAVATYDLVPTLIDLAGIEAWTGRSGRSLAPVWRGEETEPRQILYDLDMPRQKMWGWRRGVEKVLGRPKAIEIFDLSADAEERQPVRVQSPFEDPRSRRAYEANQPWLEAARHVLPMTESDGMTDMLKALGYVNK
ncbi:MAG TPA: sulfatase [Planctomycetota bacterium]